MSPRYLEFARGRSRRSRLGASPPPCEGRPWRHVFAPALLALAVLATPARAVVGGVAESGTLSRATVMVLNSRGGMCSGIVVAPDAVLTAAHCASGAGQYRIHFRAQDGAPVLLDPAAVAVHPGYDAGAVAGRRRSIDLALVRLAAPLPAPFAPAGLSGAPPAKGAAVTLGGYGLLQEGDFGSTGTFRTAALTAVEPYGRSAILLWASSPRGAGACEGDSGGPMAGPDDAVAAVTSWAAGPARTAGPARAAGSAKNRCGGMSQGVLVSPQRGWIDRTLAGWGRSAAWR